MRSSDITCCGQHADCERGLRILRDESLYYNDEELDAYKGIDADAYTEEQISEVQEVLETLRADEISDWLCALTARGIALPTALRDEAVMMMGE